MKRKRRLGGILSGMVGDLFEMPSEAVLGGWSVTVTDGREAYVTGCRAILSYAPEAVTVDVGGDILQITGGELDISRYTDMEITVRGEIVRVSTDADQVT